MRNPAKNLPDKMTLPMAKKIIALDLSDLSLNSRETKYIAAYISNGFDGQKAAQVAGYSFTRKEFHKGSSNEILKRPNVQTAIKRLIDAMLDPYKDRLEYEIMDTYYKRAMYDVCMFMEDNGAPKSLDDIPVEWRCCIDGVERDYKAGRTIVKLQLANRDTALQTLYRMVGGSAGDLSVPIVPEDTRKRLESVFKATAGSSYKRTKVTVETTEAKTEAQAPQDPPMRNVQENDW